ncbi:MAG: PDZ domain-containing protein [Clostridia bacterium]|nr:PDZ domain-containing protein [Clostridia bacterium]
MNEYKWYNDDFTEKKDTKVEYKPSNTKNTSLSVVILTIIISAVCSIIVGIIVCSAFFSENKSINANNEKLDFSGLFEEEEEPGESPRAEVQTEDIMKSVVEVSVDSVGGFINKAVTVCTGNGIVLTQNGYILTSEYVREVDGDIYVTFEDGERYQAEVAGSDSEKYVTVLKVSKEDCVPAVIGNSSEVKIGERVFAVGNKISNSFSNPVTSGIICGYSSDVTLKDGSSVNVFQTDTPNMVNSIGGVLYNKDFRVIGISTVKFTVSSTDIGLVTPIDDIKEFMKSIIENTEQPKNFNIGISGSDAEYGVTVENVVSDSPAEKAGFKYGDIIMKINGEAVASVSEINKIKKELLPGEKMVFLIYRDGETIEIELTVE